MCGLTTPICVQATADGLHMEGFRVVIASDACASQPIGEQDAKVVQAAALARLGYVIAEVALTEAIIAKIESARLPIG